MKPLCEFSSDEIKTAVAERYGQVASTSGQKFSFPVGRAFCESVGYDPKLLDRLPVGICESFTGAGNPKEYVDAKQGESVLDLGCGAGLDLYHYAQRVGPTGRLLGLDLSMPMLEKARANLNSLSISNVDWLHAPSDAIPLPDESVGDCQWSLQSFARQGRGDERVLRVLKPGGRTIFAEIVLTSELRAEVRKGIDNWFRCIGGALVEQDFPDRMRAQGFSNPRVLWSGRNERTGHAASICAVIRTEKA